MNALLKRMTRGSPIDRLTLIVIIRRNRSTSQLKVLASSKGSIYFLFECSVNEPPGLS
jgi:hypothetical protein